jgi:hypothetical protein
LIWAAVIRSTAHGRSMVFCIHCGAENINGAKFCVACGKNVQASRPSGQGTTTPDGGETETGLITGQVLSDRFVIQKLLGAGGMGRVYLAEDKVLDRPAAVKVLRDVLSRDTGSVRRLVEEAKASIRLAHPNIVRVDDYHDAGTVKFLVMEYVEGEPLADRLARETKLNEAETRRIGIEICKGLEHAHQNRVVHRDLKPGNVLLGKDGSVKIADFGIARVARDSVSRLTSQQDSGTLLYMSPEQLLGKSNESGDIYSLGVVLYEMISGDPPFKSGDVPYQIREVTPEPLRGVSASLAATVMKCLQKLPADRFATPQELRRALEGRMAEAAAAGGLRQSAIGQAAGPSVGATLPPVPPVRERMPEKPPVLNTPLKFFRTPRGRMIIKHALLGALGFGSSFILAFPLVIDAYPSDLQIFLIVCPTVAGLLGSILLKLKRRNILLTGAGMLIAGVIVAAVEFTRNDVIDAWPFFIAVFVVGGGIFGDRMGRKRWQETSAPGGPPAP